MADGWTTLGELKPGTLFEDERTGLIGFTVVKKESPGRGVWVAWVGKGEAGVYYSDARVRPLPSPLTEEDRREAKEELRRILDLFACPAAIVTADPECDIGDLDPTDWGQSEPLMTLPAGMSIQPIPPADPEEPLRRLLWLLDQPPEFLGLLQAAAVTPADRTPILICADWLRERGCEADGKALEEGWRERLMGLIDDLTGVAFDQGQDNDTYGNTEAGKLVVGLEGAIRRLIGLEKDT